MSLLPSPAVSFVASYFWWVVRTNIWDSPVAYSFKNIHLYQRSPSRVSHEMAPLSQCGNYFILSLRPFLRICTKTPEWVCVGFHMWMSVFVLRGQRLWVCKGWKDTKTNRASLKALRKFCYFPGWGDFFLINSIIVSIIIMFPGDFSFLYFFLERIIMIKLLNNVALSFIWSLT